MVLQQAPQLETERLVLKHFTLDDFSDLKTCWADPEMIKINRGELPTSEVIWARLLRYIGHWQALGYGYWAVFEKATHRYIGAFGFQDAHRDCTPALSWPEAGWTLTADARGKGYAKEALGAILSWADNNFTSPLCCIIAEDNQRSYYLAEKFNFHFQDYISLRGKQVRLLVRPSGLDSRQ
jgi:RimJ/RimL family protein N-acetyltransferase